MVQIGYTLSSEEHGPVDLVRFARRAEEAGFDFATISDHFHPWIDRQGQSPFVWATLGAIAATTRRLRVGTAVTCPTMRMHPAIVAQAGATVATMMPGRFFLGLGTGENLNEHILGDHWPPPPVRLEMLEEAIEVIRLLWRGGTQSHRGRHYVVEKARIYTLPEELPPILVAASAPKAAELAGRLGDGLIGLAPDEELMRTFEASGGGRKPRFGQIHVCWARDAREARRTAREIWPNSGIPGSLFVELRTPSLFEEASELVEEEHVAKKVICGPDPAPVLEMIREFADAGYDYVFLHQIGPDQEGFFGFFEKEIRPKLR